MHCLSTVFLLPFCIVYPPPSYYLFALSVHRRLITYLHCLSTALQKGNKKAVDRQCKRVIRRRWTDNAKGNQKAMVSCIVCPPSSDYLFALSIHRLLITFLHCLSTVFWLPFCIVCPPSSYYLFALSIHRLITFLHCLSFEDTTKVIRGRWTDIEKR
jgi:hypothetical protein